MGWELEWCCVRSLIRAWPDDRGLLLKGRFGTWCIGLAVSIDMIAIAIKSFCMKYISYMFAHGNDDSSRFSRKSISSQFVVVCTFVNYLSFRLCELKSKSFIFLLHVQCIDRQCGPDRSADHTPPQHSTAQHRARTSTPSAPEPRHNLTFPKMTASSFSKTCHWQGS
jgi:hypothetical protein